MSLSNSALKAAHLIDRLERLARSNAKTGGLYPAQWEALRFLARANRFSRTPATVAEYLASTRGTVSQTLISLEEKRLVMRMPSARDKRSVELALTPEGEALLQNDPLLLLAQDIAVGVNDDAEMLAVQLSAILEASIRRNGGKAFGVCHGCRHFERDAQASADAPHRCGLLNEPLGDSDSQQICAEYEIAPTGI